MKCSSKRVREAILFFADEFKLGDTYRSLHTMTLPELVKMMSYELFVNQFDPRSCPDEYYENYRILHGYATELRKNGEVTFEEDEPKPEYASAGQISFEDIVKMPFEAMFGGNTKNS